MRPLLPAACQIAMTSARAIQPPKRLEAGTKPAPRKRTRRVASLADVSVARSSMLDLALGIDRLIADQRPDLVLQREQFFPRGCLAALGARHRHAHDLADTP